MRKILQRMHWRSDQSIQKQEKDGICQEVTRHKEQGMVNCFHSWLAGWEKKSLRFKVQLTMIKVIFRSPCLAWRDSLRSNSVQSPQNVTLSHMCLWLPFSMAPALLPITAMHSTHCLFLLRSWYCNTQGFYLATEFALYSPLRRSYWPELVWTPTRTAQLYQALPGTKTQVEGPCYGSASPFATHSQIS